MPSAAPASSGEKEGKKTSSWSLQRHGPIRLAALAFQKAHPYVCLPGQDLPGNKLGRNKAL